jgi:hypothetical protein
MMNTDALPWLWRNSITLADLAALVAVAVLLFGAGFWFLSEQVNPG